VLGLLAMVAAGLAIYAGLNFRALWELRPR
jgi:hypothetical protein